MDTIDDLRTKRSCLVCFLKIPLYFHYVNGICMNKNAILYSEEITVYLFSYLHEFVLKVDKFFIVKFQSSVIPGNKNPENRIMKNYVEWYKYRFKLMK